MQMGTDGHRNVIYRDSKMEGHYENDVFKNASVWLNTKAVRMQDAINVFKGREDIILIPHHPLVWMNWDCYDEQLDRLVEVYSCWGSSEYPGNDMWDKASPKGQSVVEALSRGYKLGFVGGSDSHTGYVGRSLAGADRYRFCCHKAGYTAVFAEELSREAIFDALKSKYCYATTGARIIVSFLVDKCRMGLEVSPEKKKEKHTVQFSVAGTDKICLIEIIRDGSVVYKTEPYKDAVCDEWIDTSEQGIYAKYYYLRVTQVDGNRAWASPVWV
jgi:hypothetical protein